MPVNPVKRPAARPPSLRLFYALWPDPQVRARLAALLQGVQGRLVPPENLHLTMAFLGQQPLERVPLLLELLAGVPPLALNLCFDRYGYFRRHGVLWVGMQHEPPGLFAAQQALTAALRAGDVHFDAGSPFRPHITLARDAKPPPAASIAPITWQASRIVLVSSEVREKRVYYRVLDGG